MQHSAPRLVVTRLGGTVTVAFKKRGGKVYATALEFDIVGIGPTRAKAFQELQQLLYAYVEEVLRSDGKVRFYCPSEADEWETPDKEYHSVMFVFGGDNLPLGIPLEVKTVGEVRKLRKNLGQIQLQPAMV
ncbi:MAG: hypothetical protein HZB26_12320 [Candidatus Hydrogenedentes bacterium]|nr:hypothetical protein [Candidatus Hydrogenedentota bacterium]